MEDEKSNEFKDELDAAILDRLSTTARLIGLLESKRDLLLDNNKLACMQAAEKATGIARAHIKARYDAIARRIILKCSRQIDYEMSKATANI
jgi:hypothetical protein